MAFPNTKTEILPIFPGWESAHYFRSNAGRAPAAVEGGLRRKSLAIPAPNTSRTARLRVASRDGAQVSPASPSCGHSGQCLPGRVGRGKPGWGRPKLRDRVHHHDVDGDQEPEIEPWSSRRPNRRRPSLTLGKAPRPSAVARRSQTLPELVGQAFLGVSADQVVGSLAPFVYLSARMKIPVEPLFNQRSRTPNFLDLRFPSCSC
jgi:hypothetical protein